ncbi:MAG: hypothetical protein O3A65_01040 [Proteobacteria bacterium]|nr:hypothetical protein [Pseudomonadota bacterium]
MLSIIGLACKKIRFTVVLGVASHPTQNHVQQTPRELVRDIADMITLQGYLHFVAGHDGAGQLRMRVPHHRKVVVCQKKRASD